MMVQGGNLITRLEWLGAYTLIPTLSSRLECVVNIVDDAGVLTDGIVSSRQLVLVLLNDITVAGVVLPLLVSKASSGRRECLHNWVLSLLSILLASAWCKVCGGLHYTHGDAQNSSIIPELYLQS